MHGGKVALLHGSAQTRNPGARRRFAARFHVRARTSTFTPVRTIRAIGASWPARWPALPRTAGAAALRRRLSA